MVAVPLTSKTSHTLVALFIRNFKIHCQDEVRVNSGIAGRQRNSLAFGPSKRLQQQHLEQNALRSQTFAW